jgi:DNA mismatch endonuclease (patch repair protein)
VNKPRKGERLVPVAPPPTSPGARAAMRGNTRANTRPELIVRRLLHMLGYSYRLHAADLPGKPDIIFRRRKIALFVHGCFWHQHPSPDCPLRSKPRSNVGYWNAKLARNIERDRENQSALEALGWRTLTVWECETNDPEALRESLKSLLQ